MRILSVTGTEMFVGEADDPRQVLRVELDGPAGDVRITVTGRGVAAQVTERVGDGVQVVEVGLRCTVPPATEVPVLVEVRDTGSGVATAETRVVVAEPGWTVWMVSHFHYDPVWWNTQAAYTTTWGAPDQLGAASRADWQHTGFDLVRLHLETARRDPDYKFVLSEIDYLKPYWDSHPQDRAYLRALLAQDRMELMGGTYNEPNTNLTSAESTIRNLIHGVGFQRDVLGGDPRTAWQLDAFGHDPQFPGLVADAGLDSSSWARGPFHQWGPMLSSWEPGPDGWGDPSAMQFASEFEWLAPSGRGVLTHYMPAHYSAGWQIDSQPTLAAAQHSVYSVFRQLKKVAATRNVLLPVGTDYTPPAKWVTDIQRDWNARYRWPRFVCALPREFFAAVRDELDRRGVRPSAQTRDMNPVYTGKDVSFIDTKQAQRHTEALLTDAEIFATIAATHGAPYPHEAIDKAWRQLVYGAHHDAITGSESDQVYLDLLTGWREAYDLANEVLAESLARLSAAVGPQPAPDGEPARRAVVFNPSSWPRTDLVRLRVPFARPGFRGVSVRSGDGRAVPASLEHPEFHPDGSLAAVDIVFLAAAVPAIGYRTWELSGTTEPAPASWSPVEGEPGIANGTYRLEVDPARGGCVSRLTDLRTGREILQPGQVGNELLVYDEYPAHPRFHEGPWHLLPTGAAVGSSGRLAAHSVRVEHSPLGQRITVTGAVGPLRFTQQLTLWDGIDRLDATTHVDDFTGADHLVRLRWPAAVPGALPVSEVGNAVVGRGFGLIDVDSEPEPWTLDNPAQNWFALSSTARVEVRDPAGERLHTRAIGVAEIVAPGTGTADAARELAVALVRQGVTATTSTGGARYGRLDVDSNLPDVRIALGAPDSNAFTAQVLSAAGPEWTEELARQLAATGHATLWVPAAEPLTKVWVPNADLTDPRALPVVVVVGDAAVRELCAQLDRGVLSVRQPAGLSATVDADLDDYTVALVNRGVPGFAVDVSGALHLSLLRSCTGWPSGVWIDPPRRTAPDGSAFQQQHWTHSFDYSLVAGPGDWRANRLVGHGHEVNHPLLATLVAGGPADQRGYLTVRPAGQVIVTALKPAGNPLATGLLPADTVDRVTARVYEATGRASRATLRFWAPVLDAVHTDLLELPGTGASSAGDTVELDLTGAAIAQVTARFTAPPAGPRTPAVEPFQPVYSRYWLHNTGPAPIGNLPVSVHLDPPTAAGTEPVTLTVTVASDLTRAAVAGQVEVLVGAGWDSTPATIPYHLGPGEHLSRTIVVTRRDGRPETGAHWVRAQIAYAGQTVQDVTRLLVGVHTAESVSVVTRPEPLQLRAGQTATIPVRLSSDAPGAVSVQAHLISPWQTWELFPVASTGIEIPAGREVTLSLPVRVPARHRPGRWWALVRLAHAGELLYTNPIEIEVLPS